MMILRLFQRKRSEILDLYCMIAFLLKIRKKRNRDKKKKVRENQ